MLLCVFDKYRNPDLTIHCFPYLKYRNSLYFTFGNTTASVLVIQVVLLLGAVEWVATLYSVAQFRIASGLPWARMAIILGSVALFTTLSSLVFRSKALKERY